MSSQKLKVTMVGVVVVTINGIAAYATLGAPLCHHPKFILSSDHLFQANTVHFKPSKTVYDGPFHHGSSMTVRKEDETALADCFASLHLKTDATSYIEYDQTLPIYILDK
jgi:hypothetical protein